MTKKGKRTKYNISIVSKNANVSTYLFELVWLVESSRHNFDDGIQRWDRSDTATKEKCVDEIPRQFAPALCQA